MMGETLETLRKEINGKRVVLHSSGNLCLDAICLAPPKGNVVSIKPYGYIPMVLLEKIHKAGFIEKTLEWISRPEYCFATHHIGEESRNILERIASIPEGGKYNFDEVTNGLVSISYPSCPY